MPTIDANTHAIEVSELNISGHAALGGLRMTGGQTLSQNTVFSSAALGNTFSLDRTGASNFEVILPSASVLSGSDIKLVVASAAPQDIEVTIFTADEHTLEGVITAPNGAGGTSVTSVASGTQIVITADAAVGDYVIVRGVSSSFVHVQAVTTVVGGITAGAI